MTNKIKKLALACFVAITGITFATAVIPTINLSPVEGSAITVRPNSTYSFEIFYTYTNFLAVYADDGLGYEIIPIPDARRNSPTEYSVVYGDVIQDYDVIRHYEVIAISEDGNEQHKMITYRTLPKL